MSSIKHQVAHAVEQIAQEAHAAAAQPAQEAHAAAARPAQDASAVPWVERVARWGYATKGLVYVIIGILAGEMGMGSGIKNADLQGALQAILQRKFGPPMLGLVMTGLLAYALWRFFLAITDPERKCSGLKGLGMRCFYIGSGLIYAALAFTALTLLLGWRAAGAGDLPRDWTAQLVPQPLGRWMVGALGLGVLAVGLYQLYRAATARFRKRLKLAEMSEREDRYASWIAVFGIGARGLVFCLIGWLVLQAALTADPDKVQGIAGALRTLEQQRFGPWLLVVIAAGLIAYGIYNLLQARYRHIPVG